MGLFDDLYDQAPAQQPAQATGGLFDDLYDAPAAPVQQAPAQNDYRAMANAAAMKYQLDPRLFSSQIQAESNFDPMAKSKAGAMGLGQLMPGTAGDLGVTDPFNAGQNLEGSAKYMRQLLDRYQGDTDKALAAYNWGMGNVDKFGLKMLPKETRDYLAKIKAGAGEGVQASAMPQAAPVQEPNIQDQQREAFLGAQYRQGRPASDTPLGREVAAQGRTFGQSFAMPGTAAGQLVSAVMPDTLERSMMPGGQTFMEYAAGKDKEAETARKATGISEIGPAAILGAAANPLTGVVGSAQIPGLASRVGPKAAATLNAMFRGGAGAAMVPTTGGDGFATDKAAQIATGAVAGPLVEGAGKLAVTAAGKVAGAVRNKMGDEGIDRLADLSRQWGIDLLAGDYDTNRRFVRGIEGQLLNTRIPGLNIDLERQQQQGRAAAEKFVKAQAEQLNKLTFQGLDRVKSIAAGDSVRAKEAQAVLRMVDEAGADARRVMQASGNLKWLRMKVSSDQLFDDVERLAGNADIAPSQTLQALDRAETQADKVVDVDRETLNLISRWRTRLATEAGEGGEELPPNTYMRMREFLTDIRGRIDNATQNGTTPAGQLWLKDIARGVQDDMDQFAATRPKLKAANERANAFYRDRVLPFQQSEMARALRSDNPDDVYAAFIRAGASWKGDHAQRALFKALDEKGRAAARAGMVEDAFRQATDPEHFSPIGFNKVLRSTGYESFFQGPARRELDGLMHIVDHISRSDPAKLATFTPMIAMGTGAGLAGMATGAVAPATVAGGLATTGALKWLVTSEAGRRLLYSANLYRPGSPKADQALAKILQNATTQFGAATGRAAGNEQTNPGSVLP